MCPCGEADRRASPVCPGLLGPSIPRISRCHGQGPSRPRPGVSAGGGQWRRWARRPITRSRRETGTGPTGLPVEVSRWGWSPVAASYVPSPRTHPHGGRQWFLSAPQGLTPRAARSAVRSCLPHKHSCSQHGARGHLSPNTAGPTRRDLPAPAPGDIRHYVGTCRAGRTGRGSWPQAGGGRTWWEMLPPRYPFPAADFVSRFPHRGKRERAVTPYPAPSTGRLLREPPCVPGSSRPNPRNPVTGGCCALPPTCLPPTSTPA